MNNRWMDGGLRPRVWLLVVVVVGVLSLVVLAGVASAEPLCTDSWVGGVSGEWQTAANWSAGHVPSSSDVACVGSGDTVEVSGSAEVGVLVDAGGLRQTGGSLEIAGALEPSSIASYALSGGVLKGSGVLDITSSLSDGSTVTMEGSGSTVIGSSASAELGGDLKSRTLVNHGMATVGAGVFEISGGGRVENSGTFIVNYESRSAINGLSGSSFLNTGKVRKTAGSGIAGIEVVFENQGAVESTTGTLEFEEGGSSTSGSSWVASPGAAINFDRGTFTMTNATWRGLIESNGGAIRSEGLAGENATLHLSYGGTWSLLSGTTTLAGFEMTTPTDVVAVSSPGALRVSGLFKWAEGTIEGSGEVVVEAGAAGTISGFLRNESFLNEGQLTVGSATLEMFAKARFENTGTFIDNLEVPFSISIPGRVDESRGFWNRGTFQTTGSGTPGVEPTFYNGGVIEGYGLGATGFEAFKHLIQDGRLDWGCTLEDPSYPKREVAEEGGVCTGSGDLSETQSDFSIGGRGVGLDLSRTYNSQAAQDGSKSVFGNGWTSPYSAYVVAHSEASESEQELEVPPEAHFVTLVQENGSTAEFIEEAGGGWKAPPGSPDVLTGSATSGYVLTFEYRQVDRFSGSTGRLESITDRFGNKTSLSYNETGQLENVTDPTGRTLKFTYNSEGLVASAEDPMKHVVVYEYGTGSLAGDLLSVSQPGETAARWQFKYEGTAQLTEMTDGRGGKTKYLYNSEHRVTSKTDRWGASQRSSMAQGEQRSQTKQQKPSRSST